MVMLIAIRNIQLICENTTAKMQIIPRILMESVIYIYIYICIKEKQKHPNIP